MAFGLGVVRLYILDSGDCYNAHKYGIANDLVRRDGVLLKKVAIAGALVFSGVWASQADMASRVPEATLTLPKGFVSEVFADGIGSVRHIVVAENGWLYGALSRPVKGGFGAVALRDADGDGVAEQKQYFAKRLRGTGVDIHDGYLYYGTNLSVIRWKLPDAGGAPTAKAELVAHGFTQQRQHAAKTFTFDNAGSLYVNVGAPSNSCMENMRTKGSKGMDPCPILDEYAGIWRFSATELMQHQHDAERYVTGVRNAVALDWNPYADALYLVQHGRDQLAEFFPEYYSLEDGAKLPAEEMHKVQAGSDVGWPYSYYDQRKGERMMMPEYGGDGKKTSGAGQTPVAGFPGHWGPNDLLFLRRGSWPEKYHMGAFIAFHGSWNRAPLPQDGYNVVYQPLDADGNVTGDWEIFADGFAGKKKIMNPRNTEHRPTGLAEGPDGALYISSSMSKGRIWKVTYVGE